MEKRKNIAFLVYDISLTGGAEIITKQLAEELSEQYLTLIVSLFQENEMKSATYKHYCLNDKPKSISRNVLKFAKELRKILVQKEIDLLFAVTAGVNSVAILACRKINTKVVFVEHSNLANQTYGKKHYFRQRIGALYAQHIVTLTQRDKDNYLSTFNIEPEKVSVIPNWFENVGIERMYDAHSKMIISVGRLVSLKGYDTLLEVAKIVFAKFPDWQWDIYGDGSEKQCLIKQIGDLRLEKNVNLKGNVTNIREIYHNYAMFVLGSRYEGIPMVMLEAQVAHLPLVSFDCQTGPREIITNSVNGDLIRERDINAMASAIIDLIQNDDKRCAYAAHAQDNLKKFDKAVVLEQWKELIAKIG